MNYFPVISAALKRGRFFCSDGEIMIHDTDSRPVRCVRSQRPSIGCLQLPDATSSCERARMLLQHESLSATPRNRAEKNRMPLEANRFSSVISTLAQLFNFDRRADVVLQALLAQIAA